jgi:glucokinase
LSRVRIPAIDGTTTRLEQVSSGTAVAARARALVAAGTATSLAAIPTEQLTAGAVAETAKAGDATALGIFTTAAVTLGVQLANLTRRIDPQVIALGGGVTLAGNIFWEPLRHAMQESLAQDSIPIPDLVEPALGGDAGLHGAALALRARYEPIPVNRQLDAS